MKVDAGAAPQRAQQDINDTVDVMERQKQWNVIGLEPTPRFNKRCDHGRHALNRVDDRLGFACGTAGEHN